MPLEKSRAQFRQLADLLRAAIESGDYPPGSVLPPEVELATRFEVNRITVNRAVTVLRGEGLVRVERGRGTIVREIPAIHRSAPARFARAARERAGARGAFDTEIRALGMAPRSEVSVQRAVPPARVARALGLPEGQLNTLVRMRRMYANDVPVQLAPSYIPLEIAQGTVIEQPDTGPGGIISRLAELGYAQARITESVRLRRATSEEQRFLRLEEDHPVTEIWRAGWTAQGRAVEVCVHVLPAYLWVLDYEWPLDMAVGTS